jgi:hypothetical protein
MLDLLTGGWVKFAALGAAILALVGYVTFLFGKAREHGRMEEELKHANAKAANLEKIKRAARARPTGSVHDDPDNRDNG